MPDEAKRQDLPLEDKKEQVVMTTTANGEAQDQDMHAFWHSSSHLGTSVYTPCRITGMI
jgi:hypothetical protein